MESLKAFYKYLKTDRKWVVYKPCALPLLSLILFFIAFLPKLPGMLGNFSDILFKLLKPFDIPIFLLSIKFIARPAIPILIVIVAVVPLIFFIRKGKHKHAFIILTLFFNVFGILFSFFFAKSFCFNYGLRTIAHSTEPVIEAIEKFHDEKGYYPIAFEEVSKGVERQLNNKSLSYSKISDEEYSLIIVLPQDRYCNGFINICRGVFLRYETDKDLKDGCDGNFAAFYNCVNQVDKNWYLVRNYQHF